MKVYVDKVSKKLYSSFSFAEGVITFSALVGIITLSVVAVISLRPRGVGSDVDNTISVSDNSTNSFIFQNVFEDSNIDSSFNQTSSNFSYTLTPSSIEDNSKNYDLINVLNDSTIPQTIQVSSSVKGYAQDALSIYLYKGGDQLEIFNQGVAEPAFVSFDAGEQTTISLEILSTEKINFPVEISISAQYSSL